MSTFLKYAFPVLFGIAGLVVAICLATDQSGYYAELFFDVPPVVVTQAQVGHPLNSFPRMLPRAVNVVAWSGQDQQSPGLKPPVSPTPTPLTATPNLVAPPLSSSSIVAQPKSQDHQEAVSAAPDGNPKVASKAVAAPAPLYVAQGPDPTQLPGIDQLPNLPGGQNPFQDDGPADPNEQPPAGNVGGNGLTLPIPPQNPASQIPGPQPEVPLPHPSQLPRDIANQHPETTSGPRSQTIIERVPGEGDDRLSLTIPGEDLTRVLQMLSVQGDLNILASKNVQGTVSATLKNVKIETALDAILKSTGFIWWQDGRFIHVGTPQDRIAMQQAGDKIGTRLYRPNYVKAGDLQLLITPILTPTIGTISVTAPSQVGIAPDGSSAGGDGFAGQEALLVRDYESVLAEIDQIVEQVDMRPTQVAIEAMILSVNLADKDEFGVDFEVLRDKSHIRVASGNPLGSLAQMDFTSGGLKVGFLDSSLALFLNALESVGDTNVIATPRLMCLNKHRAEILIGEQLGYVSTTQTETSTTQSVEFLEVGTQLRIRPFISSDGMVRMEVHPELSTGNVRLVGDFTLPDKRVTQVTTNIMVRDGCTVIIGGLLRDEMSTTATQIPLFGSLPVVGAAFRKSSETLGRQEILVLITPRIVYEPETCCRGDQAANEFHHRQMVYADQMFPFSKRYLGRKYFRLAQMAWDAGNARQALRLVNLSIYFDPINRAAIDLRVDIWNGAQVGDHTLPPEQGGPVLEGEQVPLWLMQRLDQGSGSVDHPLERGRPGSHVDILKPEAGYGEPPRLPPAEAEEVPLQPKTSAPQTAPSHGAAAVELLPLQRS